MRKQSARVKSMLPLLAVLTALGETGCRQEMYDQPRANALSASDFVPDGAASQQLPPHSVARGELREDQVFYTGRVGETLVAVFPFEVTMPVLERGQQQFNIYCAVCHGRTGAGNGMIVQRGFPAPPSLHEQRLREAPPGHYYDVITNGFGVMYSYANRVQPADRWAITAYIRALQLSQHAALEQLPPAIRKEFTDAGAQEDSE